MPKSITEGGLGDAILENDHRCTGQKRTETGFVACDDCGSPIVLILSDASLRCPKCEWDGHVFCRTLKIMWCWCCGHEWDAQEQVSLKDAH